MRSHLRSTWVPALFAGLVGGVGNALLFLLFLPHLFDAVGWLGWTIQLVAWYVLLGVAGLAAAAVVRGLLDRRVRDRRALTAFYLALGLVAIATTWVVLWLDFGLLARPIRFDAGRVLVHLAVAVAAALAVWLLSRVLARSLIDARRLERWAVASGVVAASGLLLAWSEPSRAEAAAPRVATELPAPSAPVAEPRNLLLLTVDTLRADHLGFYGYPRDTSPALDRLAAAGAVFEAAFAQKASTSPSVASILTGLYPRTHGVHNTSQRLPEEHVTLAETLQAAGYRTGAVVTNGNLYPLYRYDQGFEDFVHGTAFAREITDRSLAWLERNRGEDPFFLWVHYTDPHADYTPPPPYDAMFVGDARYRDRPIPEPMPRTLRGTTKGRGPWAGEEARNLDWHLAQYDGEIRYTDDEIGRLLEELERAGELASTLVVFTADHGESFGEQGYFGHGQIAHDSGARVPLVFWEPARIAGGRRIEKIAETVDIVPTVLELLGLRAPAAIQGRSWARHLLDPGVRPSARRGALVEAGFGPHFPHGMQQALRTRQWLYVWRDLRWIRRIDSPVELLWIWNAAFEDGLAADELYELAKDPHQSTSVLRAREGRAVSMRGHLLGRLQDLGRERPEAEHIARERMRELDPAVEAELEALGYLD